MSKLVEDNVMYEALAKGVLIGKTEPVRATKFAWWGVYLLGGNLIAVCFQAPDDDSIFAEEITKEELSQYVEDFEKAKSFLN